MATTHPVTFKDLWRYHRQRCVHNGIAKSGLRKHQTDLRVFLRLAALTMPSLTGASLTTGFAALCAQLQPEGGVRRGSRLSRRLARLRDLQRSYEQLVGLRKRDYVPAAFTYALLAKRYGEHLASAGHSAGTIDNRLRTLDHWQTFLGLKESATVGPELLDREVFSARQREFSVWCEKEKRPNDHGQTLFDRVSHSNGIHQAACSWELVGTGTTSVGKALRRVLIAAAGSVRQFILKHPEVRRGDIQRHCADACRPSREVLTTVERLTGLTPGTLTDLLPPPRPDRRPRTHRPSTPAGEAIKRLVDQPYRLRRTYFPATLQRQLVEYTGHKVGFMPGQGNGLHHSSWRSARIFGKVFCPTGERFWGVVERFMGWLHHERGMPLAQLNFALLGRADLVLEFAGFQAERRGIITCTVTNFLHIPLGLLDERGGYVPHRQEEFEAGVGLDLGDPATWLPVVSATPGGPGDARSLEVAISLLGVDVKLAPRSEDSSERHARLCAEYTSMSATLRWESWCRLNRRRIAAAAREMETCRQVGRPHQERSGDLFALDRPDSALLGIIHQQIAAMPLDHMHLRTRWEHARDSLLLLITFFGAFRQRQLRECEFIPSLHDDSCASWQARGGLQLNSGQYEVWVPTEQLKNGRFLRERHPEGYIERGIPARYNSVVQRYLLLRDEVLKQAPLPPAERHVLFFNWRKRDGKTRMMNAQSVNSQVVGATYAYGGEELKKGLNVHVFRHVRATGLLIAGGDVDEAAILLCDREETIRRHYSQWVKFNKRRVVKTQERILADCDRVAALARSSTTR